MSAFRLSLCFVVAALCISAGEAASQPASQKRAAGSCQWRQFQVPSCVASGYVNFQILHDPDNKPLICREIQPAFSCLVQHKTECPSIPIFQGLGGMTADNFLSTFQRLCMVHSGRCAEQQGGASAAEGCDKLQFQRGLQACPSPLYSALRDNQMCQPLQEVIQCVEQLMQLYQPCAWMTSCLTRQLQLVATYFRAIRVFSHSCQP